LMKKKRHSLLFLLPAVFLLVSCVTGIEEKDVAPVYYNLGNAYMELEEYEKAAEAYLQALSMDDSFAKATFNLAKVYIEKGDITEAIAVLEELLEDDPENAIILSTLAYANTLRGGLSDALAMYEQALDRDPYNSNALYNAAVIHWRLENNEEALELFRQVLEIEPEDDGAMFNIGMLHREAGNNEKAISYLSAYLEKHPKETEALKVLGTLYFEEEYYAKAMEMYDRILEISEENPEIYFQKAYILLTVIGNSEEGFAMLEKAVFAGYKEREKYRNLIENPELLGREQIEEYLSEQGLLDEEAETAPEGLPPNQRTEESADSTESKTSAGVPDPLTE
jgi:FimV-like protein